MPKLPRASGDKHIQTLKKAGWKINHIEGSHYILIKEGNSSHLSVPVHTGKTMGPGLLKRIIKMAGMTNEEYCNLFKSR
ncbi:type II toxin-antitoxin system HicA family toxin [Methanoplanus endosymbiosus]|uniref:Type II toxin-antitoxin system HicA family toxin n=1 Tax=Methanoplanus endosymbiosus TaxID=33865 RepID=A0A9E7PL97_9EURY|nr:type II toxin-antitoxin system HicA family toxin [Methanoplanus endosymbiosus]UUX92193.1 type II toxin-antitoxin system HicA family toxin [Methanoplanus endosymbiosus]